MGLVFFILCSFVLVYITLRMFRSWSQKADTPLKRIGICLFIISVTILAINLLAWGTEIFGMLNYYSSSDEFSKIVNISDRKFYAQLFPKVFYISACSLVIGLAMFKGIFDKFNIWIMHGNKNQEASKASDDMLRGKRLAASPVGSRLSFKNGQAALEYSCAYMDCGLRNGSILPALVLDSSQLFGTETAVKIDDNGLQTCSLKVASDDGGFLVLAQTAGNGPNLEPGMLVAWQAGTYSADIAKASFEDQRFGWVGLIIAALHPDLDIEKGWSIHEPFNS